MRECFAICRGLLWLGLLVLPLASVPADAGDEVVVEDVLRNQLNNLESQSIQRRGKETRSLDLLNRQDDKVAGQRLNMLKTRDPRRTNLPLLERQLDRSRRPGRSLGRP